MRMFAIGNSNSPKEGIWKHWLQNSKEHMYIRTANHSVDPFTYTCRPTIQLCLIKRSLRHILDFN